LSSNAQIYDQILLQRLYEDNLERRDRILKNFRIYWVLIGISLLISLVFELPQFFTESYDDNDLLNKVLDGINGILGLAIIISFISLIRNCAFFIRDVYHSLSCRVNTYYSVSHTFWSWFIPVLWWFRPYQIIQEIEIFKNRQIEISEEQYKIKLWWLGFLFYYWSSYLLILAFFILGLSQGIEFLDLYTDFELLQKLIISQYTLEITRVILGVFAYLQFVKMTRAYSMFQKLLQEKEIEQEITNHLIE